jgi:hypothetical protein
MAPNSWFVPWRNRQHLLSRMAARGWDVVYSNGPFRPWELRDSSWRQAPWFGSDEVHDGVKVCCRGRLPIQAERPSLLSSMVIDHHANRLKQCLTMRQKHILCLFHPRFEPYARVLNPHRLIYYLFDDFAGEFADDQPLRNAHHRLVEGADLLITTTAGIARSLLGPASDQARLLPNGADTALIASLAERPEPAFLRGIPAPRIMYTGVVNLKVDLERIGRLAASRLDWHWVFVGPCIVSKRMSSNARSFNSSLQQLLQAKNVHFVDAQPFPDFLVGLHHSNVNVICTRERGGWWVNSYPLKFHEYLATGKPVVSTPIESIMGFESVARFASTDSQWLQALGDAIESGGEGTPEARRVVAREHDWNRLTARFEDWLLHLDSKGGRYGER